MDLKDLFAEFARQELCCEKQRELADYVRSEFANGVKIPYTTLLQVVNVKEIPDTTMVNVEITLYHADVKVLCVSKDIEFHDRHNAVQKLHRAIDNAADEYSIKPRFMIKEIVMNDFRKHDPFTKVELLEDTMQRLVVLLGNMPAENHVHITNFKPYEEKDQDPILTGHFTFISNSGRYKIEIDIPELDYTKIENADVAFKIIMDRIYTARRSIEKREALREALNSYSY